MSFLFDIFLDSKLDPLNGDDDHLCEAKHLANMARATHMLVEGNGRGHYMGKFNGNGTAWREFQASSGFFSCENKRLRMEMASFNPFIEWTRRGFG